jgi:hypothetical protein
MNTPESVTNIPSSERNALAAERIAAGARHLQYRPRSIWRETVLPGLVAVGVEALIVGGFYLLGALR